MRASWRSLLSRFGIAIASVALLSLTTSCGSSRQASSSSSALRVESLESVEKVLSRESERVRADSVVVEVRDTLHEVTTVTIDRNDKGDTLKVVQVTDRYRGRDRSDVRSKKEDVKIVRDTVYIERRDSVRVQEFQATSAHARDKPAWLQGLKWIFWIIIGLIALVIVVRIRGCP